MGRCIELRVLPPVSGTGDRKPVTGTRLSAKPSNGRDRYWIQPTGSVKAFSSAASRVGESETQETASLESHAAKTLLQVPSTLNYPGLLASLSDDVQRVVLRTAFLPWLTAESAVELTDEPEAPRILDSLVQDSRLLVREVGPRIVYRYTNGFRVYARELARACMPVEELQALLWRAAELMESELTGDEMSSHSEPAIASRDVIRIRALGGFSISRGGKPIPKQRKAQAKPLALIKALVALGPGGIPAYRLADVLWPDADGDRALARFNATLHRARKLLGVSTAVNVCEGLVSLNRAIVACDVFEFEQVVADVSRAAGSAETLTDKVLRSYPGTLLPEHLTEGWIQPCRARLAAKFTSTVLRLGALLQAQGKHQAAQSLYLDAISREPLSFGLESFLGGDRKLKVS